MNNFNCSIIQRVLSKRLITENFPFESVDRELTDKTLSCGNGTCGTPWAGEYSGFDIYGKPVEHEDQIFIKSPGKKVQQFISKDFLPILKENLDMLGDKPLIMGGHYMPDVLDLNKMPFNSFKTLEMALGIIKELKEKGESPCLLLYINDIHMTTGQREEFYQNFRIPRNAEEEILKYTNSLDIFVISEDYLLKNIRNKKIKLQLSQVDLSGLPTYEANRDWLKGDEIRIYQNKDIPTIERTNRCTVATVGLINLVNLLGCTGFLLFIPICGYNGEIGIRMGEAIFPNMPRITVMTTRTCY